MARKTSEPECCRWNFYSGTHAGMVASVSCQSQRGHDV